jgi:hypothetical protein
VFPELLEEIAGIAEAAEVDRLELLNMNLNPQLSYVHSTVMECTQVLAMRSATIDGKTYVGKTRDLQRGPTRQVVLHRQHADGGFTNGFSAIMRSRRSKASADTAATASPRPMQRPSTAPRTAPCG